MTPFKIATFNANSIRARLDQILGWLEREQPDVLCIQETKVQDPDFPREPIEATGYTVVFAGQKAHAGVATISKQAPTVTQAGFDDGSDAPRLLYTQIGDVHIVNTYVPQGRDPDHSEFQRKLARSTLSEPGRKRALHTHGSRGLARGSQRGPDRHRHL